MPNEDLHKPLESINKSIASLRQDVQKLTGEVKKVSTVVQESAESIRDAIQENIQAQAELKLMEYQMEVQAVKPQIEAEQEQIRTEQQDLDAQLQRIRERYAERQQELDQTARERIRELGSHIFEFEEEQFEEGIEDPFTEQVTTTWDRLRGHNAEVGRERRDRLNDRAGEVIQTIHDFVDRQDELVEEIDSYRFESDALSEEVQRAEPLQVPYYVVEYEVDGEPRRETVFPSTVDHGGGTDWCSLSLSTIDGAPELIGDPPQQSRRATKTEGLFEFEVASTLAEHGSGSLLAPSYDEAVAESVPESGEIPVQVPAEASE